jgi:hypothetical protein
MMALKTIGKTALLAALALALPGLAGCSMDDVQLNGKVFDAMGMNTTGSVKKGDPKMAAREPLVVPPGLDSLPPPGSGKEAQPTLAEIQDPDRNQKVSKAELEKQQAEYCKVHYDQARAQGDNNADLATGPLGPCQQSIFSAVKKWTSGNDDGDDSETQ